MTRRLRSNDIFAESLQHLPDWALVKGRPEAAPGFSRT
jgi:hypothetical protein